MFKVNHATSWAERDAMTTRRAVAAVQLMMIAQAAFADGLDNGKDAVVQFSTWLYGTIGAGSLGYMGWEGIKLYANKITWTDFGAVAGKVFAVGGAGALATYMYSLATK